MKTRILILSALIAAACTPNATATRANLIGTLDLVLVDEVAGDVLAARDVSTDGTTTVTTAIPSRYVFITSADTNELRVYETFRTGLTGRDFVRAPNPLETLSIPVLERPSMLAADEGRNSQGARVTGSYVYAARPGGAEVSVISIAHHRQLGGRPMVAPGPVTAIAAHMDVDTTASVLQTPMPATTRLYTAVWDGSTASIFSAEIPTGLSDLQSLKFQRVLDVGPTPIASVLVVGASPGRTFDGLPFCDATACLAVATRSNTTTPGRAFMLEPQTGRLAYLSFPGPVKQLVNSGAVARIYGVLDEQTCGAPPCGGVVAVDVTAALTSTTGTLAASFPAAKDALGLPWRPLRSSDGVINGLSVASGASIQQSYEVLGDGGVGKLNVGGFLQQYNELGAIASSTGVITFFSGLGGSIIDYDALRSTIPGASVRLPGTLADGGVDFVLEDGGTNGSNTTFSSDIPAYELSQTFRSGSVKTSEVSTWSWDISDGYLQNQSIAFVYQGQIPGLVNLPTTAADGVRLLTGGFEVRTQVGDVVRFLNADTLECGRGSVATVGAGFIEVAAVPAGCEGKVAFTVRATDPKPIVVAGDIEGYMGRWALGETMTYSRPYVLLTADVTASRTALTVKIPATLPAEQLFEGAFTTLQVLGHLIPYELSLDTVDLRGCYTQLTGQVVMGNLVMEPVPTAISNSAAVDFRWTLFGVVPSGNSLVEVPLQTATWGPNGSRQGSICRR